MGQLRKNGIIYGGGDALIQPVIYSTEERCIGVWEDGKPLYQKTIHTGALPTGNNTIAHNILNAEHIIQGYGKYTYSTYESVFPFVTIGNNSWNISLGGWDSTNIIISVGSSYTGNYAVTDSYITLRYTKTTDTAGDGDWSPLGIPAVHYSYDEQVVGTWVDGRPIYQKSFYLASGSLTSKEITVTNDLSGIDRIMDFECVFHDDDDGRDYSIPYNRLTYDEAIYGQCFVKTDNTVFTKLICNGNNAYPHISNIVYTVRYVKLAS